MSDEDGNDGSEGSSMNVDDLSRRRKMKIRGGHKAHITRLIAQVDECLDGYTNDHRSQILTYKSCLERKADVISKLDEEILDALDDEKQIETEIDEAETCQNKIRKKIIDIDMKLEDLVLNNHSAFYNY